MKKEHLMTVMLAIAAIVAINWVALAANGPASAATAAAVVDVQKVFNTCGEKADIDANFQSSIEKLTADLEERNNQIKSDQFDLDLIKADSPEYKQKREEIDRKIVALKVEENYRKATIVREQMLRYESLYRKLRKACGEVANEEDYDLVLFKEAEKLTYKKPQDLVNQIGTRKLLWSADELDITDQVIQKLNNAWEARN